jgi:hypothetical protein
MHYEMTTAYGWLIEFSNANGFQHYPLNFLSYL